MNHHHIHVMTFIIPTEDDGQPVTDRDVRMVGGGMAHSLSSLGYVTNPAMRREDVMMEDKKMLKIQVEYQEPPKPI